MATWVTHLMIADGVMKQYPQLHRRGFCVGNIAPDCNVENEDWTAYTPSREVTHWMNGEKKLLSNGDRFCQEYICRKKDSICSKEQYAFLLGYYAHLITDAAFQAFIWKEERVRRMWDRIKCDETLRELAQGYPETWDSVRKLIPKKDRMREIYSLEAEYLHQNPDSGYLNEIIPLKEFLDYIDYLPSGCIVRKIGVMGYIPKIDAELRKLIFLSGDEFAVWVEDTVDLVINKFKEMNLIDFLFK